MNILRRREREHGAVAGSDRQRTAALGWGYAELRRIPLPRTRVNREGDHLPTLAITIDLPANRIRPSSSSANLSAVKYLL